MGGRHKLVTAVVRISFSIALVAMNASNATNDELSNTLLQDARDVLDDEAVDDSLGNFQRSLRNDGCDQLSP